MHIPARHFAFVILSWFLLCAPALAQQVDNLKKNLSTGNINTGFDLPTGQTIRIESGATIIADAGSTVTGFGSGGTWGTITGTLSAQTDLQTALDLKANTADLGTLATLSAIASAQITDGTIVNADISASAAIAISKLATDPTNATNISSGTLSNLRTAALSGDITKSAGSGVTTLANTTVTAGSYTAANITVDSKGRITAAASEDGSGLTALNASNLASGEIPAARMPALTGDVTTTAGGVATTIATGAVGPTQLASTAVTAGSYTNTNLTVDADGRITAASNGSGGGGAIAKTGFATKTDTATTTSTTFTSVFSASFTPTSASNSVIITAVFPAAATSGYAVFLKITRGGTDILRGDANGSSVRCHVQYNGGAPYTQTPITLQVKDSPATTSPVTYQVEWCVESGGTAYFNRSVTDAPTASYGRGAASMRFDEVTP